MHYPTRYYCDFKKRDKMNILDYTYLKQDALEFMKSLPDRSVKLVITSPPYNVGKEYETRTSLQKYLENLKPYVSEIFRILSDDGSVCWEVGNYVDKKTKEIYPLDIYFYDLFKSAGMQLRNRIIWHFNHGLQCDKRFSGRYESILWFTKTDKYTFNLDSVRVPSKYPGKKYYKGAKKGQLSGNPFGKNPDDLWEATIERLYDDWEKEVWEIPNVKSNHPEKTAHPCQFPIELVERCVLALTNEDDIVLDPFAGVGSTIIAALKNGRRAMGTELMEEYIKIGEERISKLKDGTLETRPIWQTVYEPSSKDKIAKMPVEFIQAKLDKIETLKKQIGIEEKALKQQIKETAK